MVDAIKGIRVEIEKNKGLNALLLYYRKGNNLFLTCLRDSGKTSLQSVNSFRSLVMSQTGQTF